MSAGMVTSKAWGMTKERASSTCVPPSATDPRGFGPALSDFWEGGLDTVAVAAHQHLLAGARASDKDEWNKASQRRPYKPSALHPVTASFSFWRPAASKQLASLQRKAACHNKCSPYKKNKGGNSQGILRPHSYETATNGKRNQH